MRQRRELPASIQNAPELWPGLEIWHTAFWELCSERDVGWGLGPIPGSEVRSWGREYGLDAEQLDDLQFYIRAMDHTYLTLKADQKEG